MSEPRWCPAATRSSSNCFTAIRGQTDHARGAFGAIRHLARAGGADRSVGRLRSCRRGWLAIRRLITATALALGLMTVLAAIMSLATKSVSIVPPPAMSRALFLCHTRQGIDETCAAALANALINEQSKHSGTRKRGRGIVPVQFRCPDGSEWSGRGKPPRWLVALEQQSHNREEYRVKDGQSDLVETAKREHAAAD